MSSYTIIERKDRLEREISELEEEIKKTGFACVQYNERIRRLEEYEEEDRDKFPSEKYEEVIGKKNDLVGDLSKN